MYIITALEDSTGYIIKRANGEYICGTTVFIVIATYDIDKLIDTYIDQILNANPSNSSCILAKLPK